MLDPEWSRRRQQRLLAELQRLMLDAVVVGSPKHVYYLTAHLPHWSHHGAFVLFADGTSWLATANHRDLKAAADDYVGYAANAAGTQRLDQPATVAALAVEKLKQKRAVRVGLDASDVSSQIMLGHDGQHRPIEPTLWQLRRRKDSDELELMRGAIRCTDAMHRRAREIVEPGVAELTVYAELVRAATEAAGELLTASVGNDFACGVGGGPPRGGHVAKDGQLYVLDLGPAYRGYYADNCRTIAVNRRPTDAQLAAYETIAGAFPLVEAMAKPGVRCQDIVDAVDDHFQAHAGVGLVHHLGHGVGLQPHEYPHLNPHWDDVLEPGDVFTVEPGLYGEHLASGMRIEDQYLVTETGVQNLVDLPRGLVV